MAGNYQLIAIRIAVVALVLKIGLIVVSFGTFAGKDDGRFFGLSSGLVFNLLHLVSVLGILGVVVGVAAFVKKQRGWRLYLAIPISILAILVYPMTYVV